MCSGRHSTSGSARYRTSGTGTEYKAEKQTLKYQDTYYKIKRIGMSKAVKNAEFTMTCEGEFICSGILATDKNEDQNKTHNSLILILYLTQK
jgi:ubiquitin